MSFLVKGVSSFVGLVDAPHSFSAQAKKVARVNAGETGLEFGSPPLGFTQFYGGGAPTDLPWAYESPLPWTPAGDVFFSPIMKINGCDQVYIIDQGTAFWLYNITLKTFTKLASPAYAGSYCYRTIVPDSMTSPAKLYVIGDLSGNLYGLRVMAYTISSNSWSYSPVSPYYDLRVNFSGKLGGNFSIGDTVTGVSSGAQLKVTVVSQNGSGYLDGSPLSEINFQNGEQISNGLGVTANVSSTQTFGGQHMLKSMVYKDANNIYIWAGRNDGFGSGSCNRGRVIKYDPTGGHFTLFSANDDYNAGAITWYACAAAIKSDFSAVYGWWCGHFQNYCKYTLATDTYSRTATGKSNTWGYQPNKLWYRSGANDQQGYLDTLDESYHDSQFAANTARTPGYGVKFGLSSDGAYIIALARSAEVRLMSVFGTGMWQLAQISPTQRVLLMVDKPNDGFPVYGSKGGSFVLLPNYQTTLLDAGTWSFFYSKAGDYSQIKLSYCFLEGG